MKVKLTDLFGYHFGTVTTTVVVMIVGTWCAMWFMHYHALLYRGVDIPVPDIFNAASGIAAGVYGFYRKGASDGTAGKLITQIDTPSEIKAVTEDGVG